MRNSWRNYYVEGQLSPRGTRYLRVEVGDAHGFIQHSHLADERGAKAELAGQGLILGPAWREFYREASSVSKFEAASIADRVGWNNDAFVSLGGQIFAPKGAPIPELVAPIDPSACARAGSLEGWRSQVAERLTDQALPMTLFMAVLAAPLLELVNRRENIGIEVAGRAGSGKSTLLDLCASIGGEPRADTSNTTLEGLESEMSAKNSHPVLLDEANLYYGDESRQRRGARQKALAFRLAAGTVKNRYGGAAKRERYWFTYITSTNELMRSVIAFENPEVAAAAADRIISLQIKRDRPYQTFDFVPEGYTDSRHFANTLAGSSRLNHGNAMPAYIRGLVDDLANDRAGTLERIEANVRSWCDRVGIDGSDGSKGRVAEAFGLLYAAGLEGRRHGILPASWGCGSAVEMVYREFYTGHKAVPPFDDELRAFLRRASVRDLDTDPLRRMGSKLFGATSAFLRTNRKKELEAIIPSHARPQVAKLLERVSTSKAGVTPREDYGRGDTKRQMRSRKPPERAVVLVLPSDFLRET